MSAPVSPWTPCKVKFYSGRKGFGFLYREGARDIFIHAYTLDKAKFPGSLHPEETVEVQFQDGPRGLHAINIRVPQ